MKLRSSHKFALFLFLLTFIVLCSSLYFQYALGYEPCPLCMMQRICIFILMLLTLFSCIISSQSRVKVLVIGQIIFCVAGLYFAGRQVWLQSLLPGNTPACMPGLDVLLEYFPWKTIAHALFWGDGGCAAVTWKFLGLSMAAWSALFFIFILICFTYQLVNIRGKNSDKAVYNC
jgi:disulfide bond formation protein DsbB